MKHELYTTWTEKLKPPPLQLVMHLASDDHAEVEAAGEAYGRWLREHASGGWMRGLRKALKEHEPPTPTYTKY